MENSTNISSELFQGSEEVRSLVKLYILELFSSGELVVGQCRFCDSTGWSDLVKCEGECIYCRGTGFSVEGEYRRD